MVKTESARLAARAKHLEQEVSRRDDRIGELSHALTMLDQDHDSLRAECDERDERIVQLQQQLKEKVRRMQCSTYHHGPLCIQIWALILWVSL